jgi:threonine dehydratase
MPTTAPNVKIEGARGFGAEVTFAGTTSLDRKRRAEELADEEGLTMVPPFDHPMIIAGQGTVGLEILDQCPNVATVIVEVGGGGLSSGVAAAVKQRAPHVRVIGVEPEGAAKMSRSLEAGKPITLDRVASIADGLMTVRPGELTFEHVRAFVDEVVTVADADMVKAIAWLYRNARLVVEPSGSVTTAAVMLGKGGFDPTKGPVVAIVSGGNVEAAKYAEYITAPS